ncbi:hypothetical protein F4820DRAFT_405124 [Hypoxylon rubiginosum]|uniref:Uncharacterized protein n=1 Tax=Hypoxylon rubiginosum TaxID=110542 RepID=A0ACB9ZFV2_9PEZI|nr:hypothetical protein F4820DRAFT_405124 [Hypoxylon rubiginosum]
MAKPATANTARNVLCPLQKLIELGSKVEIRWVPGHVGVEGNARADRLAGIGSSYASFFPGGRYGKARYGNEPGLLPFLALSATRHPLKTCPLYGGRPLIDLLHWRKEDIINMLRRISMKNCRSVDQIRVIKLPIILFLRKEAS